MNGSERTRTQAWFGQLPEVWRPVALEIHELLMDASPRMTEQWKYNTPFYSHHRWMCYLSLQPKGLVLGFVQGAKMADPEGLLAHTEHRFIRHFLPSIDPEQLPLVALGRLVQEAILINEDIQHPGQKRRPVRSK